MARLQPPEKSAILELEPFTGIAAERIRMPQSEAELGAAWAELGSHRHIGFDTESRPTFVKGQQSNGPDVVQFATPDHAYVFQLRQRACEELVRAVLTAPRLVKVGFDLQQDLAQLRQRLGVEVSPVLDLTTVFHGKGYPRTLGIKSAVAIVFGQRFVKSKKIATTNWANEQLHPRQLLFAANDAFVALRVMHALGVDEARPSADPA